MHPFLRTRLCRIVSIVTALALGASSCMSTVSVAYAAGAVSSSPIVSEGPAPSTEPTVVRELADRAGERKREYLLSDGNVRVEYYALPVNYRDAAGDLKPIDVTLEATTAAGRDVAANKAAGFELQLPSTLPGDWVSVSEGSAKASLRPARRATKGAAPVADSITARAPSSTTRTYEGAFGGADLSYESRPDGVKEMIVVSAPTSSTIYSFDLALEGLTARLEKDGSVALVRGKAETPEMTIPRPVIWDSAPGRGEYSDLVHYDLSGAGPVYRLDVVADAGWLSDLARIYPVMIDPSVVTTTGEQAWAYVKSSSPNSNFGGVHEAMDIFELGSSRSLGYVQPESSIVSDMSAKKVGGYSVARARFQATGCLADSTAWVKATMCTTAVDIPTVTWDSRPTTAAAFETPAQQAVFRQPSFWDATAMFSQWQAQDATAGLCTFQLSASPNSEAGYYGNTIPYLPLWTVDYAGVPTVTLTSPSGGSRMTTPQATWTYGESRTGFPQTRYGIEVTTSTAGSAVATTEAASAATSALLPLPSGWVSGQQYYARVRAASSPTTQTPQMWSAWSAWGDFIPVGPPDNTPPSTISDAVSSYTGTASVDLTATDNSGGSGVADTQYTVDAQGVLSCSGGRQSTNGTRTVVTFASSGTLACLGSLSGASVLVVGGGGGGKSNLSGGGGGGGVVTGTVDLSGNMPVTVGAGGTAGSTRTTPSTSGGHSILKNSAGATLKDAVGGGRGGARDISGGSTGAAGGSGGGGGSTYSSRPYTGGAGTAGQGKAGGNGTGPTDLGTSSGGGGGGGATAVGSAGTSKHGGNGGAGYLSSISGAAASYGGGGGGSSYYTGGAGGTGGGGNGDYGTGSAGSGGTPGAPNTGGGGGGSTNGAGGCGIVIISYPTPEAQRTGSLITVTPPESGTATHTITFWSVDASGNAEAAHAAIFTVASPTRAPTMPVDVTAETTSNEWFTESDINGDWVNDTPNDANDSGRGSVSLSWPEVKGADSYNVYLLDGATYRQVGSTDATSWTSAGGGIYPTDSLIASMPVGATGTPFLEEGGLDLRDDPTPLYAKMAGATVAGVPAYFFKICAANSGGEATLSAQPTATVQLANRTKRANEDLGGPHLWDQSEG